MGLVASFKGSSTITKICLILLLLAQICSWIAFTVPEWGRINTGRTYGIWRSCQYNTGNTINNSPGGCTPLDGSNQEWYRAVQALSIFGFMGINIAFCILVLQVFTSKCSGVDDLGFVNAVQCIVTAVCYLIAVIIFAVKFDNGLFGIFIGHGANFFNPGKLAYGFGLAIVALLLEGVTGVLLIIDNKKGSGTSPA